MSKFNARNTAMVGPRSIIQSVPGTSVRGFEGHISNIRDPRGELYLLAVSFMGGDKNFYEKSSARFDRLIELCNVEEVCSDLEWCYSFVGFLRDVANMRTVSMVVAVELVRARLSREMTDTISIVSRGDTGNRDLISVACSRADEPTEILAYWMSRYGKPIPWPIKNGVADAAVRLWNEKSFIRYGLKSNVAVSFRDLLRITHPRPQSLEQANLFSYITADDSKRSEALDRQLPRLRERSLFLNVPRDQRVDWLRKSHNRRNLGYAGISWEALSEWYPKGMNREAWHAIIPDMGVMALVRNLRNFDQAGVDNDAAEYVSSMLSSPDVIAKSRMLPYQFYSAYKSVQSVRWASALDRALTYSLASVPYLPGRTLVLVDMSGSMFNSTMSDRSDVTYSDAAALFGSAWKVRQPDQVDLFQFGSDYQDLSASQSFGRCYVDTQGRRFDQYSTEMQWRGVVSEVSAGAGASVLLLMNKFHDMGGTETHKAVAQTFRAGYHDRVVILTDEQAFSSSYNTIPVPENVPVYIWNIAGYRGAVDWTGSYGIHTFGGLTDNAFKMIPILEAGRNVGWPWSNVPDYVSRDPGGFITE